MVSPLQTALLLSLCCAAAVARAEPVSVSGSARLRYELGPGADGCPDEQALRNAVAARLGYDPFSDAAPRTLRARVESAGAERVATVRMEGADGKSLGERRLTSRAADCGELAAAMQLAITIAIDPLVLTRPAPELTPPPPPVVDTPPPPPPPPPASTEPERYAFHPQVRQVPEEELEPAAPLDWGLGVGPLASTGAPRLAVGAHAFVELRYKRFSLALEGRADLPAGIRVGQDGEVSTWLAGGGLTPCVRWEVFGVCAVAMAGLQGGSASNLPEARSVSTPLFEVGARAMADLRLTKVFSLRFHLDGRVPVTRTTLTVSGTPVWSTPTLAAALGLSAVGHLGR